MKLRPHVVIVDFEFQYFFITNGIGNHVGVQLATKNAGCGLRTQSVLRKNGGAGKSKLVVAFELTLQVTLRLTKLTAMALIKNENYLLLVNRQIIFAFD